MFDLFYCALEGFLDIKRQVYPRFYAVPDYDLAQLLSNCRKPRNIQMYLDSCFENVSRVEFSPDEINSDVVAIHSRDFPEPERLALGRNLKARGYAEQ